MWSSVGTLYKIKRFVTLLYYDITGTLKLVWVQIGSKKAARFSLASTKNVDQCAGRNEEKKITLFCLCCILFKDVIVVSKLSNLCAGADVALQSFQAEPRLGTVG